MVAAGLTLQPLMGIYAPSISLEGAGAREVAGSKASSILRESVAAYRDLNRIEAHSNVAASIFEMDGEFLGRPTVKVSAANSQIPVLEATVEKGWLRTTDAEFHLAQDFVSRYPTNIRGNLHIYTERLACPSCAKLPEQIEQIFPNVKARIYPGPHYKGPAAL